MAAGESSRVTMAAHKLNPYAKEWNPSVDSPPEVRSLYITFSNGFPLSEFQIHRFFAERGFGTYVENIDIHQQRGADHPLFGKITFTSSCVPVLILNGQEMAKFTIDGRTFWCKKYNRRTHVEA